MSATNGTQACPACMRVARLGRRFCGGCRASLVTMCGGCGFVNEIDDTWCGGCGQGVEPAVAAASRKPERASGRPPLPRVPAARPPALGSALAPPRSSPSPPPLSVIAASARPAPPMVGASAATLLAINRNRVGGGATTANRDVQDQAELDALFGGAG